MRTFFDRGASVHTHTSPLLQKHFPQKKLNWRESVQIRILWWQKLKIKLAKSVKLVVLVKVTRKLTRFWIKTPKRDSEKGKYMKLSKEKNDKNLTKPKISLISYFWMENMKENYKCVNFISEKSLLNPYFVTIQHFSLLSKLHLCDNCVDITHWNDKKSGYKKKSIDSILLFKFSGGMMMKRCMTFYNRIFWLQWVGSNVKKKLSINIDITESCFV